MYVCRGVGICKAAWFFEGKSNSDVTCLLASCPQVCSLRCRHGEFIMCYAGGLVALFSQSALQIWRCGKYDDWLVHCLFETFCICNRLVNLTGIRSSLDLNIQAFKCKGCLFLQRQFFNFTYNTPIYFENWEESSYICLRRRLKTVHLFCEL